MWLVAMSTEGYKSYKGYKGLKVISLRASRNPIRECRITDHAQVALGKRACPGSGTGSAIVIVCDALGSKASATSYVPKCNLGTRTKKRVILSRTDGEGPRRRSSASALDYPSTSYHACHFEGDAIYVGEVLRRASPASG